VFTGVCIVDCGGGINRRITLYKSLKDTGILFSFFLAWNQVVSIRQVGVGFIGLNKKKGRVKRYDLIA
jgi:ribosomal protein L19